MVANYMAVDVYKQYEYEQMELKSAGPNYAQNGRSGWGLEKFSLVWNKSRSKLFNF